MEVSASGKNRASVISNGTAKGRKPQDESSCLRLGPKCYIPLASCSDTYDLPKDTVKQRQDPTSNSTSDCFLLVYGGLSFRTTERVLNQTYLSKVVIGAGQVVQTCPKPNEILGEQNERKVSTMTPTGHVESCPLPHSFYHRLYGDVGLSQKLSL